MNANNYYESSRFLESALMAVSQQGDQAVEENKKLLVLLKACRAWDNNKESFEKSRCVLDVCKALDVCKDIEV